MTLRIDRIFTAWDMRHRRSLINSRAARALAKGHCIVAFNRRQTIGRIVDAEGGVHDYYSGNGSVFDLEALKAMANRGIGVELKNGQHAAAGRKLRKAA